MEMLQSIMISIEDELPMEKIVLPMPNCLDHRIKFIIIGIVTRLRTRKLLAKIGYWSTMLTQDCSNANL